MNANCTVQFSRVGKRIEGRDPVVNDWQDYGGQVRANVQPSATQTLPVREVGQVYDSSHTAYVHAHDLPRLPVAGDRLTVAAAYFPGWTKSLVGRSWQVTDVAPNPRGLVRCSLRELAR